MLSAAMPVFVLYAWLGVVAPSAVPSWEAPLECPGAAWVQARVVAYLRRPLVEGDAALQLRARVYAGPDGRFELELSGGEGVGVQHVSHHDCTQLADVAASLVAIVVDPLARRGEALVADPGPPPPLHGPGPKGPRRTVPIQRPEFRPAPGIGPEPEPELESTPEPERPPPLSGLELFATPEVDRPLDAQHARLLVLADAGLALGVFPGVAPTVHGGLGLESRRVDGRLGVRASVEGGAVLAGRFRSADGARGGDLSGWNVVARPCLVPRWGIVDLRACAALGAGQQRGRGVGVVDPQLGTQPWVWARAELGLAVAVHRNVALMLDLGGGANLLRPRFVLADPVLSYTVPTAIAHARLGLELRVL